MSDTNSLPGLFWVVESDVFGMVLGNVTDEDHERLKASGAKFVNVTPVTDENGEVCLKVDPAAGPDSVREVSIDTRKLVEVKGDMAKGRYNP